LRLPADHTTIPRAWIDVWNSHDPDSLIGLFAEDAVAEDLTFGAVSHCLAAIRDLAVGSNTAFPDIHFDLVE
jgi:hypothetical protein